MKVKPYNHQFQVMHVTKETRSSDIDKFAGGPCTKTIMHGIGFNRDCHFQMSFTDGYCNIYPGNYIIMRGEDVEVLTKAQYEMIFDMKSRKD